MQLFNFLFVQTTFLVCAILLLTFGSLTNAAGGVRKFLPKRTGANMLETASPPNVNPDPAPPQHTWTRLLLVLPSGTSEDGYFRAKRMLGLVPYKQDAINFYKSRSASLFNEIAAFVYYLDLLAEEFPENKQKVQQWQKLAYPKGSLGTLKQGVLFSAFQRNDLSFLNAILGPSISQKLNINYEHKLPTPTLFSFPNEMTTGLNDVWLFLRRPDRTFFKKTFSTSGVNVVAEIHGIKVHYLPMFDLASVDAALKEAKVLAASWKGISIGQVKSFFRAMHEYRIMKLHELVMYTLPHPDGQEQATAPNIFLEPMLGTTFNLPLQLKLPSNDGQRQADIKLQLIKDLRQFVKVDAYQEKQSLLQELNMLASAKFSFSMHFEKLRSTLNEQVSLNSIYNVIGEALIALKKDIRLLPSVRSLLSSFSILDQYHSFESAAYTLARDYFNAYGPASHKVYGNKNYGIQLKLFGNEQVQLIYQSILGPTNFQKTSTNYKLAMLIEKLDLFLMKRYISDFQKILMEIKIIKGCFLPRLPSQAQPKEIPVEETKPRRQSQLSTSISGSSQTIDSFVENAGVLPSRRKQPSNALEIQTLGSQTGIVSGVVVTGEQTKPRRQSQLSISISESSQTMDSFKENAGLHPPRRRQPSNTLELQTRGSQTGISSGEEPKPRRQSQLRTSISGSSQTIDSFQENAGLHPPRRRQPSNTLELQTRGSQPEISSDVVVTGEQPKPRRQSQLSASINGSSQMFNSFKGNAGLHPPRRRQPFNNPQ